MTIYVVEQLVGFTWYPIATKPIWYSRTDAELRMRAVNNDGQDYRIAEYTRTSPAG